MDASTSKKRIVILGGGLVESPLPTTWKASSGDGPTWKSSW
jgi:hypothetical protein